MASNSPQASASKHNLFAPSTLESDWFKIYCYKIVPCAKKFGHDWSECPFAHEGEKACRRCPALYLYSSIVCPDVRQSKPCPRGDVCPYSHSIFEYWMHTARFRAQICSYGPDCNRRICFFAHAQHQLRTPSEPVIADALAARAPYLQGRVAPKSRYALYPEHVPAAIAVSGAVMGPPPQQQQQQQQQQQPGLMPPPPPQQQQQQQQQQPQLAGLPGGQQQLMQPQMVLVQADAGGQPGIQHLGGVGGPFVLQQAPQVLQPSLQQQWVPAGGPQVMYVPAQGAVSGSGQPQGGAGIRYLLSSPGAAGGGGDGGGGAGTMAAMPGGGLMHQPGALGAAGLQAPPPAVAALPGAGGPYGSSQQPMQLVGAVAPDGGFGQAYSIAPGGGVAAGSSIAYAMPQAMYATASMAMQQQQQLQQQQQQQQQWVMQPSGGQPGEQPQQPQHLPQLVQVPPPPEGMMAPDTYLVAQQPFATAQQAGAAGGGPGYAVLPPSALPSGSVAAMAPATDAVGAGVAAAGAACGPPGGGAASRGPGDAGGGAPVDDITQQMGGWRIS